MLSPACVTGSAFDLSVYLHVSNDYIEHRFYEFFGRKPAELAIKQQAVQVTLSSHFDTKCHITFHHPLNPFMPHLHRKIENMYKYNISTPGMPTSALQSLNATKFTKGQSVPIGKLSEQNATRLSPKSSRSKLAGSRERNNSLHHIFPMLLFCGVSYAGYLLGRYFMRVRDRMLENQARQRLGQYTLNMLERINRGLPGAQRLRLQLAMQNRDFTGDDYERLLQLDANVASPHMGATEAQINRLPSHKYSSSSSSFSSFSSSSMRGRGTRDRGWDIERQEFVTGSRDDSSTELPGGDHNVSQAHSIHQCSICLEPYQDGDDLRTVLCLHQFHKHCIDRWLRTNGVCPICKFSVC